MSQPLLALADAGVARASARPASARWALVSLSLSMLMPSLATSIVNAALPELSRAFGASFQATQWIVLAYLLALTALSVSAGRWGDLLGRRRLLLAGITLFTASSLLCSAAPTLSALLAARAAQGVGAALMTALTVALVGETVPKARIGSAMGLLGTTSAIGTALGPTIGGLLTASLGWRAMFIVNGPVGLLAFVLASRHLPPDRRSRGIDRGGLDAAGTLVLAVTLGAYALATTLGRGHFGGVNALLLLVVVCGVGLFVFTEGRVRAPLVPPATFRDPALRAGLTTSALVSAVMMTTLVVGPFYLSRALGVTATVAGVALSAGPLAAAVTGLPAGRLVDRLGAQRVTVGGLVGILCGAFALFLIPPTLGLAGYLAPVVAMTVSYAVFQAANNAAIMGAASSDRRGLVAGLLALSRNVGLITGAAVMGAVFVLASASTDVAAAAPGAVAAGMRTTFGVAAGLIVLALVRATTGRPRRQARVEPAPATTSATLGAGHAT